MNDPTTPVLRVDELTVSYQLQSGTVDAVQNVSLAIQRGETYGLVGESGSGKSTLAQAIIHYLSSNARITHGSIHLEGDELSSKTIGQMRALWGTALSMVPQDPLSALNPSMRVGEQIAEIYKRHLGLPHRAAWERTIEILQRVKIADAPDVARRYPHQLSGGMQQRIVIAMALSAAPRLLILDEPTTSLDVTTEAAILELFNDLLKRSAGATLFVTHNLGVVARMCERVGVMYASELVEEAHVSDLYERSLHPYTRALLGCVPRVGQIKGTTLLTPIPGQIPLLRQPIAGCVFAPRCPVALDKCHTLKPLTEQANVGHRVKCHRWREIADGSLTFSTPLNTINNTLNTAPQPAAPLLNVDQLRVQYKAGNWLSNIFRRQRPVNAVDNVSLTLNRGQTLGLVGESGSGKSSLARTIIGLVDVSSGKIELSGVQLSGRPRQRNHDLLKRLQMVFQHPEESLNPYHTLRETLRRPLLRLAGLDSHAADASVNELLRAVNLPESYADRFPGELSGGEKQRVAIARAFAAQPDLIICDEPVSSLDVSVQTTILNLLTHLQRKFETSYLFISHDLAVVGYLADVIAVIYLGQIVEIGDAAYFFTPPHHPYTEALISAIPVPDPQAQQMPIPLTGEIPSAMNVPGGCRFHTRCPRALGNICVEQIPPWQVDATGGRYQCHIPPDELIRLQTQPPPVEKEIKDLA